MPLFTVHYTFQTFSVFFGILAHINILVIKHRNTITFYTSFREPKHDYVSYSLLSKAFCGETKAECTNALCNVTMVIVHLCWNKHLCDRLHAFSRQKTTDEYKQQAAVFCVRPVGIWGDFGLPRGPRMFWIRVWQTHRWYPPRRGAPWTFFSWSADVEVWQCLPLLRCHCCQACSPVWPACAVPFSSVCFFVSPRYP